MTVGELIERIKKLEEAAVDARERVTKLESEVTEHGGFVVDHIQLPSKAELKAIVMEEDPKGMAIAAYSSPVTVSCHDKEYEPSSNWDLRTKFLQKQSTKYSNSTKYSDSEQKFIHACDLRYSAHYMGMKSGQEVESGTKIDAFHHMMTWTGSGGVKGRKRRIEASIKTAGRVLHTYHKKLPSNSKLLRIAESSLEVTSNWFETIHHFFDTDIQELTDTGIPADKTLVLLSDYIIIMFDGYFRKFQKLPEFTLDTNHADWITDLIWVTLEVMEEVKKLTEGGNPKYDTTLGVAFVCFLTTAAAKNSVANLKKSLEEVKTDIYIIIV